MKRMLMCLIVVLMALAVQAQTSKTSKVSKTSTGDGAGKSIAGLEQQWVAAVKASNPEGAAPLLADGFVSMDSDGTTHSKAQLLAWIKGSKWDASEISDVRVTTFGNTAIATGAWRGKGTSGDGKSVDAHERWVDTWLKMPNGKWQCIASASAPANR